jgi:CDGSH-type Zn-finger protein
VPPARDDLPLDDVELAANPGDAAGGEHDDDRAARITPYRDGPLVVRGPFRLVDQDGREIEVSRRTVALCRCGKSGAKPFCDGTHKLARFAAPSRPAAEPVLKLAPPPR